MNNKITNDTQEHIILLVTVQKMLENGDKRKDIVQMIDEFIYPHLQDEKKQNKSNTVI